MRRIPLIVFLLLVCANVQAWAGETAYYLNLLDTHPKIQAILAQQEALTHQADGAMGLPDPSVFLGVDNVPVSDPSFDRYLPSSKVIGFSQSIPNGTGRQARKEVLLATAGSTELFAEYTKSSLHALFFTRIASLERVRAQIGYEEKKKSIIAQLQEYYAGQIVSGAPIYQKTFMIEIELTEVERTINSLMAEKSTIEADLIQLVGEVPEIDDPGYRQKEWAGELTDLYPIRIASMNIDVEKARVESADSEYLPDFGVTGTYKFREDGVDGSFDGEDWFSLQFRMTLPLWAATNQTPKLEAAKSSRKSKELQYREAVRKWQMETTRLRSEKQASSLNIGILQKKDVALEKKIIAMERTYSAGQTDLEPVLLAEMARLSLLSQIAAEQQRYVAISEELNGHIIATDKRTP